MTLFEDNVLIEARGEMEKNKNKSRHADIMRFKGKTETSSEQHSVLRLDSTCFSCRRIALKLFEYNRSRRDAD